ncbi:radical SAM family heme chaperone HemW [Longimicrobium sp.]|uniref:radical SAM family heme chaperone HemW n=1 Tax=Longimicrobium sp. TaxID=2029185 RepID=UPI002BDFB2E9|nr:radical SAM family heme chaperone HemW [Longimicrobium sp.]HSU15540.1 radical SAM family heme chaperone HemW [Longimicrobium sp.]
MSILDATASHPRADADTAGPDDRPRSLYVHVPFCVRRCSYCDFAVQATREAPTDDWLDAVAMEMRLLAEERGWSTPLALDTVYLGGGTPSLLRPDAMAELRRRLEPFAVWNDSAEWTCEANPESFTAETARAWRDAGVNRISLGAQTFHEPALRWMGRMHGVDGPRRAVEAARAAGFGSVSVDLIFGLPSRLGRDWGADLFHALALEPEHVSLYGLTAEAAAPLGRWVSEGRETLADEDRYADEYLLAHERLTAAGFEHYEVSNFGLPGRRSRHNFVYWTGAPYAALGPGAHAFHPPLRRWNVRGWDAYRAMLLDEHRLPTDGEETVDEETAGLERAWLHLRTDRGWPLGDAGDAERRLAETWVRQGWARVEDDALKLTADGWLLLDRLAVEMASAAEKRAAPAARQAPVLAR